jgi:hypothetical protein
MLKNLLIGKLDITPYHTSDDPDVLLAKYDTIEIEFLHNNNMVVTYKYKGETVAVQNHKGVGLTTGSMLTLHELRGDLEMRLST